MVLSGGHAMPSLRTLTGSLAKRTARVIWREKSPSGYVVTKGLQTENLGWRYESGLAGMFASTAVTRCALRRKVLYWGDRQRRLLPFDLPCADREREKCPL